MHKPQCVMCDKERQLNADDWCSQCVEEFQQIQQRQKWVCHAAPMHCITPVTCAMKKQCCLVRTPDAATTP